MDDLRVVSRHEQRARIRARTRARRRRWMAGGFGAITVVGFTATFALSGVRPPQGDQGRAPLDDDAPASASARAEVRPNDRATSQMVRSAPAEVGGGPAPTTTTTTTAPVEPRRMSLVFTGDVLLHGPVVRSARAGGAFDFAPLFAPVAPLVSAADVSVCHMEVPLDDDNTAISSYPLFYAPREVATGLTSAGFDSCSTASNHSLDKRFEGIRTTLEVLDAAGVRHTGTGRTPEEAAAPALYEANGMRVAHLSYTYGTNGLPLPSEAPWSVNVIDPARIEADAAAARQQGADAVVVSLHWGVEYRAEPTAEQRALAEQIAASGAVDVIIGHHAHVPQTIEQVGGTWVVFGLGNFVSNQSAGCCSPASQDGLLVRVDLLSTTPGASSVERIAYEPLRVDKAGGFRVVPVGAALLDIAPRGTLGVAELQESHRRTVSVVDRSQDDIVTPWHPVG